MKEVPVLVTYDIHLGTLQDHEVTPCFDTVLDLHRRLGIKASFSFPAEAARVWRSAVRALVGNSHAVGNHSLTHGPGEIYDRLPPSVQEENLRRATEEIEAVTQQPVRFFRAPAFRISGATIHALERLGYEAELSVNSQRLGLLSSDPWNVTWMLAPRGPYHPNTQHPWRRGRARLWEIPLSCALLPFMSNTLLAFGLPFMRVFFRALYLEARISGNPIVFMTHPEELCATRPSTTRRRLQWRDFWPSRYGFGFRHALMETDPVKIARWSVALLEYMHSFEHVRFFTVPEYVRRLNGQPELLAVEPSLQEQDHAIHTV